MTVVTERMSIMAFTVSIEDVNFGESDITAVQYMGNTPNGREKEGTIEDGLKLDQFNYEVKPGGGNARSTDFGLGVKIWGRINFSGDGDSWSDNTVKLAEWALRASDAVDAYRKVEVKVVDGGQIVRQYNFPKAFVVEYNEELDDETGMGHFYVHIREKKDWNGKVKIDSGFEAKEDK